MKYPTLLPMLSFFAAAALAQEPRGVEEIFSPGYILEDRNGDGVVDFVNAALRLGDSPSEAIVAAAADVAARLAFETMAMNLPLTGSREGVVLDVGTAAPEGAGALAPGEGLVTTTSVSGREHVLIAGADDEGIRAAASYLAGRAPHLWNPEGPTFETVREDVAALIGLEPRRFRVKEVRATRHGVSRLSLAVELASADEVALARRTLGGGLGYEGVARITVALSGGARTVEVEVPRKEVSVEDGPVPPRPGGGPKHDLDLSNLFTPEGLLGDSDQNLIADRIDALLSAEGSHPGVVDLAARLGLEAAGISIPVAKLPSEIEDGAEEPTLVLVGDHPAAPEGEPDLAPGEGSIRVVPGAFGEKSALVIAGGDGDGVARALEQVAERFPSVWERGKDRTTLDDVEMDLWNFFSGRSPAGQAAIALYKLDRLVSDLSEKSLTSAKVLVSLEKPDPGFEAAVAEKARALAGSVEVVIDDRDVQNARTLFEEELALGSEVEDFWRLFRERVLLRAGRRRPVAIEARLSEPREVRRRIEEKALEELRAKGVREASVRVLSAYKQGYSFLEEVVAAELRGKPVSRVEIRFARYEPPSEWPQQAMHTPLRWLHEAFPIDEVLARELAIPLESVRFEMAPEDAPAYEVIATATDGAELLRRTFSPKLVLRPYLDRFRDYEMVNVTTGWITARSGDEVVLDQRIATDAERFWDRYQSETLSRIYDYVMELHEGNPRGAGKDAPFFGELEVEVELSEPHEVLGIDHEIISPMDALHEDVYFTTLLFFRILGRNARGQELTYAGRVLPVMLPGSDGSPGRASIRFSGFRTSRPAVVIDYEEAAGETGRARLDIPKVEMDRPRAMEARVRSGRDGLVGLDVRVKVDTEKDERDELLKRDRGEDVDETILSAEQVVATIEHLVALRARGAYRDALAYHDLEELSVTAAWEHRSSKESKRRVALGAGGAPAPPPDVSRYLGESPSERVQWDSPIPPPEAYGILARMASFDEATVYKVGESYLGKEVWAMDLMPKLEASHFSHYKATTLKPTILYSARQHANEVSSTSHVLKLAEELLTDPEERKKLDRVNVVIHPVTNPDGAQLAYDLYRRTPEFILHAGYLASLGMDVTSDSEKPMPIFPEARVRPYLWNMWLPDIFLNPHGYPAHQVVQLFSEYTGLVRGGRVTERNWSMNKGWFMPGYEFVDDPRFPRHKEAAFQIRDYITEAITSNVEVHLMNQRNYARYERYGGRFDDDVFKLPMVNDVLIYTALKGSRAAQPGSDRGLNPRVTIWSGTTEAPDETASGDWMKLVASAGLSWDRAILQYLLDGKHEVERKGASFYRGVSWSLDRPRPPKPPDEEETTSGGSLSR